MGDSCSSAQDLNWEALTLETGMETPGRVPPPQIHTYRKAPEVSSCTLSLCLWAESAEQRSGTGLTTPGSLTANSSEQEP